ncbi:hypothetical protein [Henriciella litoralis]|uniref:hypothetical protein n=1 Tax=Henriciella litoralis TaxID=568102 RepID=UPI000A009A0B|nr:hypothetical protein [Henriciella litoralis]
MTRNASQSRRTNSLSGLWTGFYSFDLTDEAIAFTAWLSEDGGTITGSVLEEDFDGQTPDGECESEIIGQRFGLDVQFTKIEGPLADGNHRLLRYHGDTDPDCCVVSGVWFFDDPSEWTGTFMMTRISGELKARVSTVAAGLSDPDKSSQG